MAQDFFQGFHEILEAVFVIHGLAAARAHFPGVLRIREERLQRRGQLDRITVRHQIASNTILNQFRRSSVRPSNHGLAAGHGFQVNETKSFAAAG